MGWKKKILTYPIVNFEDKISLNFSILEYTINFYTSDA